MSPPLRPQMRLLWITPYVPVPTFGGGARVYNLIKVLATSSTVDLIALAEEPNDKDAMAQQLLALCRSVNYVLPPFSSPKGRRLAQFHAVGSLRPSHYNLYYSPEMQKQINHALQRNHYDAVIIEHSFTGYYMIGSGTPVVLDQHNVESDILYRTARTGQSFARRGYNLLDWLKYRRDERQICQRADLILATSDRDRGVMRKWGRTPPLYVVPNGVDTTYFRPVLSNTYEKEVERTNLVFTASMHYSPNVEAMLYFVETIWPYIQSNAPGTTLRIVGGAPPPEIMELGRRPYITVTEYVPDLRPYIAAADVVVVPLRVGGGTRLKILEALAMGQAVVSTSLGCEGLAVEDGHHLLVADGPIEFAKQVVDLLRAPQRRVELGKNGRRLVEDVYDWRTIGARLEQLLRGLPALGKKLVTTDE